MYEVGHNHFFRGQHHPGGGDQIFYQGHASPGMYARAFMEGRLLIEPLPLIELAEISPEVSTRSTSGHPTTLTT